MRKRKNKKVLSIEAEIPKINYKLTQILCKQLQLQ